MIFSAIFAHFSAFQLFAQTSESVGRWKTAIYSVALQKDEIAGNSIIPGFGVELQRKISPSFSALLPLEFTRASRTLILPADQFEQRFTTWRSGFGVLYRKALPRQEKAFLELAGNAHVLLLKTGAVTLPGGVFGEIKIKPKKELQFSPEIRIGGGVNLKKRLAVNLHFGRSYWRLAQDDASGSHWSSVSRIIIGMTCFFE